MNEDTNPERLAGSWCEGQVNRRGYRELAKGCLKGMGTVKILTAGTNIFVRDKGFVR